jgi:hypothetical protein
MFPAVFRFLRQLRHCSVSVIGQALGAALLVSAALLLLTMLSAWLVLVGLIGGRLLLAVASEQAARIARALRRFAGFQQRATLRRFE